MTEAEKKKYDEQTVGARLRSYKRRAQTTNWIGAGLAGLIVLIVSDVGASMMEDPPSAVRSTILTLLLIAGGSLALARAGYESAATRIENRQWAKILEDETARLPDCLKVRRRSGFMYILALCSILFAALLFLVSTWWWVGSWLQELICGEGTTRPAVFVLSASTVLATEIWNRPLW